MADRDTVTVGELLDMLHTQRHLSIRFDMSSLMSLYGLEPSGTAPQMAARRTRPVPLLAGPLLGTAEPVSATRPGLLADAQPVRQSAYYSPALAGPASCPNPSAVSSSVAATPDSDLQLANEIKRRLTSGQLRHFAIDVKVTDGTCWLTGSVRDPQQLAKALGIVSKTEGVKKVVNRLTAGSSDAAPALLAAAPTASAPGTAPSANSPAASNSSWWNKSAADVPNDPALKARPRPTPNAPPPVASATAAVPQPNAAPVETPQPSAQPAPSGGLTKLVEPVKTSETVDEFFQHAKAIEVPVSTVDGRSITVATALRLALDAFPDVNAEDADGTPLKITEASQLDFLVEDDGILVTTKLRALTDKETRVYSLKRLPKMDPKELATVVCQSVRPWSWRSRIDELGEQLKGGGLSIPPSAFKELAKTSMQLATEETGITVNTTDTAQVDQSAGATADKPTSAADEIREAAMLGTAAVNGVVTLAHASLNTLEVIHYADPPTGSIRVIAGKLVITQSQAAHREIAALMKQLSDE